jgi:hypothetical protein
VEDGENPDMEDGEHLNAVVIRSRRMANMSLLAS